MQRNPFRKSAPKSRCLSTLFRAFLLISLWPAANVVADSYPDDAQIAGNIEATVNGQRVSFPSIATNVDVQLQGDLARVRVVQTFENPLDSPVNASYLFPLNKDSAVFGLTMNVGNERIRAVIEKKEKAQKTFTAAKKAGKAAALLTQHRPNMFTQRIANLMPGLPIEIIIDYTQTVPKIDGAYELLVPLVVGPRFDSGTGKVPLPNAAPVIGVHLPESVEPGRVTVDVRLESAIGVSSVTSDTHRLDTSIESGSVTSIQTADGAVIANRDFVLRYQLGAETDLASGVLSYADQRGGFFSLMIEPPKLWQEEQVLPREMVFLLDCSGSMNGAPMAASKAFMRSALAKLRPNDSFRIIRFSDRATEFSRQPLAATPANIAAGIRYTDGLQGSGGTVMRSGVEQALMVPKPAGLIRNVVFLTDGYIGNEFEILGLVESELKTARLFSLGVGSGVNRYLLDELARVGRGFARYLDPTKNVDEQAASLAARLQTPLLTDISIDWGDIDIESVTPHKLPDLYAGDSLRVQGRYTTPGDFPIKVRGRSSNEDLELSYRVNLKDSEKFGVTGASPSGEAIALVWARSAIKEEMHQLSVPQQLRIEERRETEIIDRVTKLGLDYSLATRWTSFVAVSEEIYNPSAGDGIENGEVAIPNAKVAGVSALAYPGAATSGSPHGGYAAPEPGTWLGVALLVLMLLFWLGAPRSSSDYA